MKANTRANIVENYLPRLETEIDMNGKYIQRRW